MTYQQDKWEQYQTGGKKYNYTIQLSPQEQDQIKRTLEKKTLRHKRQEKKSIKNKSTFVF